MGGIVWVTSVCRDPPIPGSVGVGTPCTQPWCLPSVPDDPYTDPVYSFWGCNLLSFGTKAIPSLLCRMEPSLPLPLNSDLGRQTPTPWHLRACIVNLHREMARGDRENKLGSRESEGRRFQKS